MSEPVRVQTAIGNRAELDLVRLTEAAVETFGSDCLDWCHAFTSFVALRNYRAKKNSPNSASEIESSVASFSASSKFIGRTRFSFCDTVAGARPSAIATSYWVILRSAILPRTLSVFSIVSPPLFLFVALCNNTIPLPVVIVNSIVQLFFEIRKIFIALSNHI